MFSKKLKYRHYLARFLGRSLSACQVADIKHFTTFGNVGKQDVDKWVLAIERCPPLIFYSDDPLDSRKIELAKSVILIAKETFSSPIRFHGIKPTIENAAAYECRDSGGAILAMK